MFTASARSSLLSEAEAAGLRPAHGCRIGICKTCQCSKRSGTVENLRTGEISSEPDQLIQLCVSVARSLAAGVGVVSGLVAAARRARAADPERASAQSCSCLQERNEGKGSQDSLAIASSLVPPLRSWPVSEYCPSDTRSRCPRMGYVTADGSGSPLGTTSTYAHINLRPTGGPCPKPL